MRLAIIPAVFCFLLAGCGDPEDQPPQTLAPKNQPAVAKTVKSCGGKVKAGSIEAYFQRLADHLAAGDAAVPMEFYDEMFSVTSDERWLVFSREEMGAGAQALPSRDDWREISRRGPQALEDLGWRGCLIADGKVWFEADGETFSLKSFNKDMPWDSAPG